MQALFTERNKDLSTGKENLKAANNVGIFERKKRKNIIIKSDVAIITLI